MYYKLSRLVLTPTSAKPSTIGEVFISNPQIDQESILGKLFFLGEIESPKPSSLKIMNFFITNLPLNYYENEKISMREKMGTIKINEIFESALAKTNAEFENFLKKEKIKINPKTVNMVTGVVYKNDLIFSVVGKAKSLLIYTDKNEKDNNINEQAKKIYKITNIEVGGDENKKINLNKIFSNITEGKIPPEGYFVFSNEILPEYINNKHLTKILTTLPPTSAIEHLKTQLHKINSYITFLSLIIKSSTVPPVKRAIPKMQVNVTTNNSLERMNETENKTERYLSPVGIINTNRYLGIIKGLIAKFKPANDKKITTILRDKILFTRKHRLNFITRFSYHAKNFFIYLFNILAYILHSISHPRELIQKIYIVAKKTYSAAVFSIFGSVRWFIRLPNFSKILLIAFIISSASFVYSIRRTNTVKNEQLEQQSYQELTQLIKQKQNQVDSSLLYKNEDKAYELLEEINIIITQLQTIKGADKKLIDSFLEINKKQVEKISHVVVVADPIELANFGQLNSIARTQNIFYTNGVIITTDPNNNTLYKFNRNDKIASVLKEGVQYIDYGTNLTDNELLLISANGNTGINNNLEVSSNEVLITEDSHEINDITTYNSRLYILSASKNNLFRYARNYTSRETWIKEDLDIRDAVSIAIDGYVYILKSGGEVIKLLSGYSDNFQISPVSPQIINASKLKISGTSEKGYIYILESANKRLIVFDKTGKFILQYKIEQFDNLKDFIVLEKEQKIIFLNNNSIYEIEAEHLK